MKEFQDITLDEIKNLTFSKAYNIVCINYDEKNGINIFTEEDTKEYLEKNIASFLVKFLAYAFGIYDNSSITF